jgi:hypothetical protein
MSGSRDRDSGLSARSLLQQKPRPVRTISAGRPNAQSRPTGRPNKKERGSFGSNGRGSSRFLSRIEKQPNGSAQRLKKKKTLAQKTQWSFVLTEWCVKPRSFWGACWAFAASRCPKKSEPETRVDPSTMARSRIHRLISSATTRFAMVALHIGSPQVNNVNSLGAAARSELDSVFHSHPRLRKPLAQIEDRYRGYKSRTPLIHHPIQPRL